MSRDGNAGDYAAMTPEARAYARALRCDDCLSDTEPEEVRPGVFVLWVRHDNSCPTYLAMPS